MTPENLNTGETIGEKRIPQIWWQLWRMATTAWENVTR